MKTLLAIILIYTISFSSAAAQNTTVIQQKNIEAFIRVWGLLKYHHPASVNGGFDADKVFLSTIESIKVADGRAFNDRLLQLIDTLNQYQLKEKLSVSKKMPYLRQISDVVQDKQLLKNINFDWIHQQIYSAAVQAQLSEISTTANSSGKHFYMSSLYYASDLPNEKPYAYYQFDQPSFHLLALAKAWNAIEYLFPYKYVIGRNWKTVLQEMIPVFIKISNRTAYEKAVLLLEVAINDSHAEGFVRQMKNKSAVLNLEYYPPFDYQVYDQKILIKAFLNDSLANVSQLKKGDLIMAINGRKVEKMLKDRYKMHPASNLAVKNRALSTTWEGNADFFSNMDSPLLKVQVLRMGKLTTLPLTLLDGRNEKDVADINLYVRGKIKKDQTVNGYEELNDQTALFRAGHFYDKDLPHGEDELVLFANQLKNKKAIIFDMRGYPQSPGLFYYYIPMAMGVPAMKFARYYAADISYPGSFFHQTELKHYLSDDLKKQPNPYTGKIVILTDEHTQSMGEWYTMMLSQLNDNTIIIGSQTAGADGDLKKLNLPGGYQFIFTGNAIFYPDGKPTQRIGIQPDILFRPTADDVVFKKDALLERAMQYLGK